MWHSTAPRTLVPLFFSAVAWATATATATAQGSARADLLIRGGTVIDGTGAPGRLADVAITGDRITFVGDAQRARIVATRTLDAHGLIVAPGFIDPHTHTYDDFQSERVARRTNAAYLMQGVTTVVTGNDGSGPTNIAEQLTRWEAQGIGTNAALFVGFGTVRGAVLGMSAAAPSAIQLAAMQRMVARGLDDGALGLSTGLYYAPQSFSTTEEVIALARESATRGGIYDSHLRDESSYTIGLLGAVREILRIGLVDV